MGSHKLQLYKKAKQKMQKMLGKRRAVTDLRTLKLTRYSTLSLSQIPYGADWSSKVNTWPMMLNDRIGDCTIAAAGHMIEQWTTYTDAGFAPTDQQILAAYEAVSGYQPGQPSSDNGAVMIDVLNYWRKTGIGAHTIAGYVGLNPVLQTEVRAAAYLFGNVYLGIQLPMSAQTQTVWQVPAQGPNGSGAPGSWGGHCVPVVQFDLHGLTVVTWGTLQRMSWQFLRTYCDEAYGVLSKDWISSANIAPNSFSILQLTADLAAL